MKLAWLTDIHLNFIDKASRQRFYQAITETQCERVLISGDIAEAPCLVDILTEMATDIKKPIYFILGNHDYYKGQINEVRDAMRALTKADEQLFWLPASGIQCLSKTTILVGQDGWADGRLGNYQNSRAVLNDSRMIADLFQEKILGKDKLLEKMQQLADLDAVNLQNSLEEAFIQGARRIIILTHVPPFKEACLHEGEINNEDWLPYFSSKAVGDVLIKITQQRTETEFLVLCGHTHSKAIYKPFDNLTVKVGRAEYHKPIIQEILTL